MNNINHKELFQQLKTLVSEPDSSFIELTYQFKGRHLTVFDYRLASYTEFLKEGAIESRGIMFETTESGDFIQLLALPMPKFFNYLENPATIGIDDYVISQCLSKEDGSLISHFMLDGEIFFKSKGSPISGHAGKVNTYVKNNPYIYDVLKDLSDKRYTANFEYVAPDNTIILKYPKEELVLLNARNMDTGLFMPYNELKELVKGTELKLVQPHEKYLNMTVADFYASVKNYDGIEGFVINAEKDGHSVMLKIKTIPYKARASVNLNKMPDKETILKLTLLGSIDDVKTDLLPNLSDDEIGELELYETRVVYFFNNEIDKVKQFLSFSFEDKRDYAIKAKSLGMHSISFGVIMPLYGNLKNVNINDISDKIKDSLVRGARKIASSIK